MGVIAIRTGATAIGIVACASMAGCTWVYALSEIVAFYRIGLPEADPMEVGRTRSQGHRPHQTF